MLTVCLSEKVYQELFEKANAVASARIEAFLQSADSQGGECRRASVQLPIAPPTSASTPRDTVKDNSERQKFLKSKASARRATVAQIPGYLATTKSSAQKAISGGNRLYASESASNTSSRVRKSSIGSPEPTFGSTSRTYLAKPVKPTGGSSKVTTTTRVSKTSTGPITPTSPGPPSPFSRAQAKTSRTSTGPTFKRQTSAEARTSTGPISSSNKSFAQTRGSRTSTGPGSTKTFRSYTAPSSPTSKTFDEPNVLTTSTGPVAQTIKAFEQSRTSSRSSTGPGSFTRQTSREARTSTGPGAHAVKTTKTSRTFTGTSVESGKTYLSPTASSARKSYATEKTSKSSPTSPTVQKGSYIRRGSFELKAVPTKAKVIKVSETAEPQGFSKESISAKRSILDQFGPSSETYETESTTSYKGNINVSEPNETYFQKETTGHRSIHDEVQPSFNTSILDEIDEPKRAYLQKENTTTYRSILDEPSPLSFNQDSTTTHRSIVDEIEPKRTTTTSYRSILDEPSSLSFSQNSVTRQRSIVDEIEPKRTTTSYRSILDEPSSLSFGQNSATTTHRSIVDEIEPKRSTTTTYRSILDEPSSLSFGQNSATTTHRSIVDEIEPKRSTTTTYRSILDEPSSLSFTRNSANTSIVDDIQPKRKTTTTYKSILDEIDEPNGTTDLQTIDTLGPLADIIERSNQSPDLNSFQYLDQLDQSFSGAQEVTTPGIDSEVPIIVASSDEALSPDPKERKGLFSSRVKSSQNWVRSFPGRSGNSEIHYSDSSAASPDIYEDRGYDYRYVTTETRKVKPKDQKILSYETTEKVPILTASSPEVEESFEKITIETPHVSDIPLPEVSAHHFGSPPKKLIDSLSKSHFEFSASDAPLITPPIERHRQAVVDKYLADKTRGGTRSYKSSWAVGSGGAQTSSSSSAGGGVLASFDRQVPEPILYEPRRRGTHNSSYEVKTTTSKNTPFIGHSTSRTTTRFSSPHQNHVSYSDPEHFIASTVQRSAQRDENLQPLKIIYGEFSDEDNTSPRSVQPSTQSDEEFIPIKVEVSRNKLKQNPSGTNKVKKTVKTVTTTHREPHISHNNQNSLHRIREEVPDGYHGVFEIEDLDDEIEDLNGNVEYVDSRQYRAPVNTSRNMQRSEVTRHRVSVPGGGYQIREARSSHNQSGGRGSSPSRARQSSRSPTRRVDNMDGRYHQGGAGPSTRGRHEVYYTHPPKEKKFLKKVQHELEEQRGQWKDEVERLADNFTLKNKISSRELQHNGGTEAGNNSFVDHSSGAPVFKAFVDVSEYPARGIDVSVDSIENKVVVKASKRGADGVMRSFTQKVSLPRYSDADRITTKLSKEGILRVEIPLLFYFEPEKKKSKSFINQVVTKPDGSKFIEVLVNVGHDTHAWNLKVLVNDDDELLITYEKDQELPNGKTRRVRKLIKKYILPKNAIVGGIKSKLARDGRLVVTVPLADTMYTM